MNNALVDKLDYQATFDCVQCGYCLPVCPTYIAFEKEKHSPRGRINLVKMAAEGKISIGDMSEGIDLCLGCRACETVCPTHVQYGDILMSAVEVIKEDKKMGLSEKLARNVTFKHILPKKGVIRKINYALYYYEKLGAKNLINKNHLLGKETKYGKLNLALPDVKKTRKIHDNEKVNKTKTQAKTQVAFFQGCIMDAFFSKINNLAIKIMKQHDIEVHEVPNQTCCGALQHHAGETNDTIELAKKNIAAYADTDIDYIVNTIGGCGASLKEYDKLFKKGSYWHQRAVKFVEKVRDISEIMDDLSLEFNYKMPYKAVYQPSCHLENVQKVFKSPKSVLSKVPDLDMVDMEGQSLCCGSAGIYNIIHFDESMKILDDKMEYVQQAKPNMIITSNPGCHMQMQLGVEREGLSNQVTVKHIVEVVAEACGIRD